MNRRQQLLILLILSKLAMIGTFYFGFWTFIYEIAWWNKSILFALMSSAVSLVLSVLCFMGWIILELWIKDPTAIPSFKLERRKKEAKTEDKPKPAKDEEEKLPIY